MNLLDVVVLKQSLPEHKLQLGAIGTVVEELNAGIFWVEFADKNGVAYAIIDLSEQMLMKVVHEPMVSPA
ncbi:MAG: DUF4926 domain-containing protein [Saprospirales bacterium]|nr:DUF4926 domain-containing protein [Saprospirales bacterium]MBK8921669.1 DUF4926 domain-containing protein [Saprospirales bacterium]